MGGGGGSSETVVYVHHEDPNVVAARNLAAKLEQEQAQLKARRDEQQRQINMVVMKFEEAMKAVPSLEGPSFSCKMDNAYKQCLEKVAKFFLENKQIVPQHRLLFIGPTSSGKSYLVNCFFKNRLCPTGMGETTTETKNVGIPAGYTHEFWDSPGTNDLVTMIEIPKLLLMKQMQKVVIVFDNDPKVVFKLVQLCAALETKFICVRNQWDDAEGENLQGVKAKDKAKINGFLPSSSQQYFLGNFVLSAKNRFSNVTKGTGLKEYEWELFENCLKS